MQKHYVVSVVAALVLALGACGKKPETPAPASTAPASAPAQTSNAGITVAGVSLGTAVGSDKKVSQAADNFNKNDTIYASIDTTGAGSATLKAKWTYTRSGQEAIVKEDTLMISTTGPATNEFHVSKPDGWPAGDYQVAVFIDNKPAGSKTFSVK